MKKGFLFIPFLFFISCLDQPMTENYPASSQIKPTLREPVASFPIAPTPAMPPAPVNSGRWQIVYSGDFVPTDADFTILDLFDYSPSDVQKATRRIAYFSAHYEDWRPDAGQFGRLLKPIGGWKGEKYVDWQDSQNQAVMLKRLDLAVAKRFHGVDIDNVDGPGMHDYFGWLLKEAKARGLKVGLKNAVEILPTYGHQVDFFVSEASDASELSVYRQYNKPTVRMYYGKGARTPDFICEVQKGRYGSQF